MRLSGGVAAAWLFLSASTLVAQNVAPSAADKAITYAELRKLPVPVTASDISDRPYRVLKRIETRVRKSNLFADKVPDEKAARELWERAVKVGADAVVRADIGDSRHPAFGPWGARTATGLAVRFVDP